VLFAHDTTIGLVTATDLVNTCLHGTEALPDTASLDVFLDKHEFTGRRAGTRAELGAVIALRSRLRTVWDTSGTEEIAAAANRLLRDSDARPRLSKHDGWDWHLHVTDPTAPLHQRIAAEAGMAFADLVRLGAAARLRTCDADECDAVLVDLSRNRSRRYCDTGNCGNRQHVAAYRARNARTRPGT
jgi:predicted RNA-binding Zn ribbon-like protein